jgi:HlyD family secretion protein
MGGASESIFRKTALERLSSPDQLDRLITLTSPLGWAAAAAVVVLVAAIAGWSIFGSVATRVSGAGILVLRGGSVFDAMAPAAGVLTRVAAVGSSVAKGEVVATLDDTQAEQDLQHARNVLREQEQDLAQLVARFDREIAARRQVNTLQRENLNQIITAARQRRDFYSEALRTDQPAAAKGYITRRFVQETRQQVDAADQDLRRASADLLRLQAEELDLGGRRDQEVDRQQEKVNAARRAVEELTIRLARTTQITSAIAGEVTEVKAGVGTVVAAGRPILSIETEGEGIEMILYVPPEHGKKIVPGMEVRIEPATVKKEEFGTLLGRVREISPFPASPEGMLAVLQNRELVARFTRHGAPYAARIELIREPKTVSGYAWSAGRGPPVTLSSGTTAAAEITVRRQAPITLVLPFLQEKTGISG